MKLYFSLATLLATADAAGVGNFFTYYEAGGLGPSRWQFLEIDGNQCGGMEGASGFGQSPVTIDNSVRITSGGKCDTDKAKYSFEAGDCKWSDLKFSISNSGTSAVRSLHCELVGESGRHSTLYLTRFHIFFTQVSKWNPRTRMHARLEK